MWKKWLKTVTKIINTIIISLFYKKQIITIIINQTASLVNAEFFHLTEYPTQYLFLCHRKLAVSANKSINQVKLHQYQLWFTTSCFLCIHSMEVFFSSISEFITTGSDVPEQGKFFLEREKIFPEQRQFISEWGEIISVQLKKVPVQC